MLTSLILKRYAGRETDATSKAPSIGTGYSGVSHGVPVTN